MAAHDSRPSIHVEVLVIGGGIMGLWLTWRYSWLGYHVLCLRLRDEERPCAETLRNQGWLQSGGRYFRSLSISVNSIKSRLTQKDLSPSERDQLKAKLKKDEELRASAVDMHYSAQEIRQEFGISLADDSGLRGVMRLRENETWTEDLLNGHVDGKLSIAELGAESLDSDQAKQRLGQLFDPEGTYLSTSERAFEEDVLLEVLRTRALSTKRARIRVLRDPAVLEWGDADHLNAVCNCEEGQVLADRVFLAAGAGTPCLLADLGLQIALKVQRTPLLVGRVPDALGSLVLEERFRSYSLVSHHTPNGLVGVVGVGAQNSDEPMDEELSDAQLARSEIYGASSRRVSKEVGDRARSRVRDVFLTTPRITAGYEPALENEADWSHYLHVPSGTNVVVVLPGRATFAPKAAALCEGYDLNGSWPTPPLALKNPSQSFTWNWLPGSDWIETPRMHHHSNYDHMDEVED
ncbi:MAG TPA: FAD-dependent oxidoreductase [Thermoanaerobaculia bacterium]|jgi:glycine/D-amino acid oxidase-like deaminating enzyme|nr:FAD-dependent oxidoreductase [Thermoanaerobaculia bacterium]